MRLFSFQRLIVLIIGLSLSHYAVAQPDRFGLDSVQTKLVDNKGNCNEELYGTRNVRVVLKNILYRGGGNNFYRREDEPKYYNNHPLPTWALDNLHKQGFAGAIYLYSKNFENDYPEEYLDSLYDAGFSYRCEPELSDSVVRVFLEDIYHRTSHTVPRPIYIHCWNGWHQSGMLSAFTLMQFCSLNNQQALRYWEQNTDNNYKGYPKVKSAILQFRPYKDLFIDSLTQQRICPCMTEDVLHGKSTTNLADVQNEDDSGQKKFMESESETRNSPEAKIKIHAVKSGETLSSIADKYKVSVKSICRENGIEPGEILRVGQKLVIPGAYVQQGNQGGSTPTHSSTTPSYYKVKSGDTLSQIAHKHHTTVDKLCKLNHIKSTTKLKVGQKLRVR